MRLPFQCKIALSHDENNLLQRFAARAGQAKATAAKEILMAVLRDDMIAHGELPARDISQDVEHLHEETAE